MSGVGGSEGEADPEGSSARASADGVDDGGLQGGERLVSDGLDLASIQGEGEDFPTYGLDFLRHGAGEPVDVVGDGFPFLETGGEGGAMEPEAAGEVGA